MTQSSVASDIHEALDVHVDFAPQTTLHFVLVLDYAAKLGKVLIRKTTHPSSGIHLRFGQNSVRRGASDAVYVGETDVNPLVPRQVDACNACHGLFPLPLTLLVSGVATADNADDAMPLDNLTV